MEIFFLAYASIAAIMPAPGDARKYEGIDAAAVKMSHSLIGRSHSLLQSGISYRCSQSRGEALVECLLLLLGALLLLGLWQASHAEHTASLRWMRGYRSADGVGCCSEHDCIQWPVALLQITGNEATVLLGDTVLQLPVKSVHATQDGQTYWCCQTNTAGRCPDVPTRATTRCVFYTVGM